MLPFHFPMAMIRPGKRVLGYYTIRGTNEVVRAGDCVLIRSLGSNTARVAHVEKIEADHHDNNNIKVHVRWYYRPEEAIRGRREFHGAKELFLSDHYDVESAHTIEGKCIVHSLKRYTKLEDVGPEDYYCRFEYDVENGAFMPDCVAVYCKCNMPYNPDGLMVICEGCRNWFHPPCVGMTIEQAKQQIDFVCPDCLSKGVKKHRNSYAASPLSNVEVEPKTGAKLMLVDEV